MARGLRGAGVAIGLLADERRRFELRREQRVASCSGEVDHVAGVCRGRHRHVRLVQRPRRSDDILAAPILAVPVERLLRGPALQNEVERFAQPRVAVFVRQAAFTCEQRIGKSRTKPEDEAAVAHHVVGDCRLDGSVDRMRQMDELDGGTHPNLLGQPGGFAHQQFRDRQRVHFVDVDRFAMMLADIGVTEAKLICEYDLLQVFFVSLGCGGVGAKAVREDAEFH